ncbi:glyoxylate/hydroxypyruvate reductase A [Reinekea sp.]|jgi:glyoxylate/hydroxypyruvate reductase A|uniref:2-hydroxyacid dehydrogenase n=1 Tax=Reinekea sp. TaxID=1970455 RepID=UPI002A83BCAE|nr:glyoxylate/hydroxypyruvate reductase A [Reinekea sp.]
MNPVIALLGDFAETERSQWLHHLRAAMPDEQILPFAELNPRQKELVEFAIVANPDPAQIAELPNLIWAHSLWAGVEKIIANFGQGSLQIVRLIDPNLANLMAEACLAWTLYLHRDMPTYRQQQQTQTWQQQPYIAAQDRTIGLLGLGKLGTAVAQRLLANGFKVAGWSRTPKLLAGCDCYNGDAGLDQLLAGSDIVIGLLPATPDTAGLLNRPRLATLKPGASLINFGRGSLIEQDALLDALNSAQIEHAVLDVFDQEPLPKDHAYWHHAQVTLLPHISAPTQPDSASHIVARHLADYRQTGRIPATVDLVRGY